VRYTMRSCDGIHVKRENCTKDVMACRLNAFIGMRLCISYPCITQTRFRAPACASDLSLDKSVIDVDGRMMRMEYMSYGAKNTYFQIQTHMNEKGCE